MGEGVSEVWVREQLGEWVDRRVMSWLIFLFSNKYF